MALVHVGVKMLDDDGDTSTFAVKVPLGALTLAQITGFAQAWATEIDDMTDGKITGLSVIIGVTLPGGLKADPVQYSEVQKGALLSFSAAGTAYRHSIRIPAVTPSKFTGNVLNSADADVAAVITIMEDGVDIGGVDVLPCDKYENDIVAYIEGVKSFRR